MQGPTGNVGEFSELYAFAKVLADGVIPVVDGSGSLTGASVGVKGGMRKDSHGYVYIQRRDDDLDVMLNEDAPRKVSLGSLSTLAQNLVEEIGQRNDRKVTPKTFRCPSAEPLMKMLGLGGLKAASDAKSDLSLEIVDPLSSKGVRIAGYTVKSILGGQPTLLNAGATVFEYEVKGLVASEADIILAQDLSNTALVQRLTGTKGVAFTYLRTDDDFAENLAMIDSSFEKIFAEALLVSYHAKSRRSCHVFGHADVLKAAACNVRMKDPKRFVVHKAKDFLKQVALGLQPKTPWDGTNEVNGGAILINKEGKVVCLCLDRDQDFRDYLYAATKFDTPSSDKHGVGRIVRDGSRIILRLSAQIRMCSADKKGADPTNA